MGFHQRALSGPGQLVQHYHFAGPPPLSPSTVQVLASRPPEADAAHDLKSLAHYMCCSSSTMETAVLFGLGRGATRQEEHGREVAKVGRPGPVVPSMVVMMSILNQSCTT